MAIGLPSSWRSRISGWRWVIFTWTIDIGGLLLNLIDWILAWVNYVIALAQGAWDWLASVVDWVKELWNILIAYINKQVQPLWNRITTWWYDLSTWWSATWYSVTNWVNARFDSLKDWVGATRDWLVDRINAAASQLRDSIAAAVSSLNRLIGQWNSFVTFTLPGLASLVDITKAFDNFMLKWRDLFNWWGEFWRDVTDFFTNPFQWIYDRLDEFFERYW